MLKGIPPVLSGPLLPLLDAMGHGDTVAVCDANFPAHRVGARCVELPGIGAPEAVAAIRAVLPLDTPDDGPAVRLMAAPAGLAEQVHHELVAAAATADPVASLDRFAFYAAAGSAFIVVRTGETRPYGNVLLTKGVVGGAA